MPKTVAEKVAEIQAKLNSDTAALMSKQAKQDAALNDMRRLGEECQAFQIRIVFWQAMIEELKL
jgi:hypothetical protein